jgi:hypothetical protein
MELNVVVQTRLLAEAYAVLTDEQIDDMARSMDLSPVVVRSLFETNEVKWEIIKGGATR